MSLGPDEAPASSGAYDSVATVLRERIVDGHYASGTRLREVSLADELGVSRNTLREGLRLLAVENLIEMHRHKGAVVKVMSTEDIRDIYIVRRTLELKAIEDIVLASPRSLQRLRESIDTCERLVDSGRWRDVSTAGLRFHQALVATLGSPRLDAWFVTIVAQLRLAFATVADDADLQRPFWPRDREIFDLILAGSRAAAGAALREYLDDAERVVTDVIREQHAAVGTRSVSDAVPS